MASTEWQLNEEAAQQYELVLVRSILGPFAEALVKSAPLATGSTVVDVGCGTGAAARFAAEKVGPTGTVIGTDINKAMLTVAASIPVHDDAADIRWQHESADRFTMHDATVDAVLCAQSLQFMKRPELVLRQMHRVLKQDASAYISLWCPLEENPYFAALVDTIATRINLQTAAGLGAAFNLSDKAEIEELFDASPFSRYDIAEVELVLHLPPLETFVVEHIIATPMGIAYSAADDDTRQNIVLDMVNKLKMYLAETGASVPFRSFIITATK